MFTTTTYDVGFRVKVISKSEYGICHRNEQGGTESFPASTELTCEIIKAWLDYETGQRYIGRTDEGQEIYFGEFRAFIELVEPIH